MGSYMSPWGLYHHGSHTVSPRGLKVCLHGIPHHVCMWPHTLSPWIPQLLIERALSLFCWGHFLTRAGHPQHVEVLEGHPNPCSAALIWLRWEHPACSSAAIALWSAMRALSAFWLSERVRNPCDFDLESFHQLTEHLPLPRRSQIAGKRLRCWRWRGIGKAFLNGVAPDVAHLSSDSIQGGTAGHQSRSVPTATETRHFQCPPLLCSVSVQPGLHQAPMASKPHGSADTQKWGWNNSTQVAIGSS